MKRNIHGEKAEYSWRKSGIFMEIFEAKKPFKTIKTIKKS